MSKDLTSFVIKLNRDWFPGKREIELIKLNT